MELQKLSVRKREASGRGSSRRLRKAGEIPAVVYGRSGNQPLAIHEKAFQALWKSMDGGASLIEIKDDVGETRLTTIKDIQKDPIKDFILHIDFNEVYAGEAMTMSIPLLTVGTPVGVQEDGGILETALHELEVQCLPKHLPEQLEVDVSALQIGESVHVSDLKLPEGVEVTSDPETVLASVAAPISEEELQAAETIDPADVPTVDESEEEGGEGAEASEAEPKEDSE